VTKQRPEVGLEAPGQLPSTDTPFHTHGLTATDAWRAAFGELHTFASAINRVQPGAIRMPYDLRGEFGVRRHRGTIDSSTISLFRQISAWCARWGFSSSITEDDLYQALLLNTPVESLRPPDPWKELAKLLAWALKNGFGSAWLAEHAGEFIFEYLKLKVEEVQAAYELVRLAIGDWDTFVGLLREAIPDIPGQMLATLKTAFESKRNFIEAVELLIGVIGGVAVLRKLIKAARKRGVLKTQPEEASRIGGDRSAAGGERSPPKRPDGDRGHAATGSPGRSPEGDKPKRPGSESEELVTVAVGEEIEVEMPEGTGPTGSGGGGGGGSGDSGGPGRGRGNGRGNGSDGDGRGNRDTDGENGGDGQRSGEPRKPFDWQHILDGDTTGFHSRPGGVDPPNARVISQGAPDAAGVYEATVEITNPTTGAVKTKRSTFFPDDWSHDRVRFEVERAYETRVYPDPAKPNKWAGTSPGGVRIEGYDGATRTTAYPVRAGDD